MRQAPINADLHCHSVVSDGTLEPEAVAARAHANGVQLWALTDHDEVSGQARACAAARALGMPYLTGTEISVTFAGVTVHILGLGFDADDAGLRAGLEATRGGRKERALEMAEGLARVGIEGTFEYAIDAPWRLEPVGFPGSWDHGAIPITISVHDANMVNADSNYSSIGDFLSLEIAESSPHGTATRTVTFEELR